MKLAKLFGLIAIISSCFVLVKEKVVSFSSDDVCATENNDQHFCSVAPKVIDGDTIDISGQRIRLACVDTPESWYKGNAQYCLDNETDCGKLAKDFLKDKVAGGIVTCDAISKDVYNRWLGLCYVEKNKEKININIALVSNGYAWYYDGGHHCDHIKPIFLNAKKENRGLFNPDLGGFKEPRLWRKTQTNG